MSRVSIEQLNANLDNNSNGGNNVNFRSIPTFFLSNDRDGAHVHFLIEDATKTPVYHVHTLQMTSKAGKTYYTDVDCLGDGCPFCREAFTNKGGFVGVAKDKLYIPMFVHDKKVNGTVSIINAVQIFSRPSSYYRNDLSPFNVRNGSFENQWVEIERNGGRGDKNVAYRLYPSNQSFDGANLADQNVTIQSLSEQFNYSEDWIYGKADSIIKIWTAPQMEQVLQTHQFPKNNVNNNNAQPSTSTSVQATSTSAVRPRTRTSNLGF